MAETPYIGFSGDQITRQPPAKKGDRILCPHCHQHHVLMAAIDVATKQETDLLLFYKCGATCYLGGVDGRLMTGVKPEVSGSIGDG